KHGRRGSRSPVAGFEVPGLEGRTDSRAGLAPKDGYRARGSRQRVRAIQEAVRRAIDRAMAADGQPRGVSHIVAEARRLLAPMASDLPLEPMLEGIRQSLDEHLRDAFLGETGVSFDKSRQPAREGASCAFDTDELLARV